MIKLKTLWNFSQLPESVLRSAVLVIMMMSCVFVGAGGRPLQRWINPCDLQGHLFEPSDLDGAPKTNTSAVLGNLAHVMAVVRSRTGTLMHKLFIEYFQDPSMYKGYKSIRLEWLKVISPDEVKNMTLEELIPLAFKTKQQYTQALEVCVIDQVSYYGDFLTEFRDLENSAVQGLCSLQLAAYQMEVPMPDTVPTELPHYRGIESRSQRNVRDFVTLAQFYNTLEVFEARIRQLSIQASTWSDHIQYV